MHPLLRLMPLLLSLLLTQCSWLLPKQEAQPELPPPTREGKNTFGCYINGKPWIPKGRAGTVSNLNMTYDPDYAGGSFEVKAFRKEEDGREDMGIILDSLRQTGSYFLDKPGRRQAVFLGTDSDCWHLRGDSYYRSGSVTITRFDMQAKVIAGTFEFVLAKPGCDTITVTDGRFDMRIY